MFLEEWNQLETRFTLMIRYWDKFITFNYFNYNTSYEGEKDLNIKIVNPVKILRIINQIFILDQHCLMVVNYGQ
jgi:hypothetical protein